MNLFLDRTLRPKLAKKFGAWIKAMVSGGAPLGWPTGDWLITVGE